MARPLRLEFPGAIYHITSRGNARDSIFLSDRDRESFLSILSETVDRHNWLCHAYCLMDNHYHLLIETIDPTLSYGMRQLNGVYTQSFNRQHNRVGHVFQGRYKSILVEKGPHLLELCRYIVLNPVKAGMVKLPEHWVWSSYNATAQRSSQKIDCLSIDWILGQFSDNNNQATKRYIQFVKDRIKTESLSPWQQLRGNIFGSAQFIAKLQDKLDNKKEIREIPRDQRFPGRPSLLNLFAEIKNKQERDKMIAVAHIKHGYTLQQIALILGVHYSTVSRAVKKSK